MAKRKKRQGGHADAPSANGAAAPAPAPVHPDTGIPCPSEPRGRFVPLLYPGPAGRADAVLLSDWAFGWSVHWGPGGTSPHVVPDDDCPFCRAGQLPRWTAYVPCLTALTWRHRILQISSEAWLGCADLSSRQGSLRGLGVSLRRLGTAKNGKVTALVIATKAPPRLPDGYDVRPVLSRLWGMKEDWLETQCGPYQEGVKPPGVQP